MDSNTSLEQQYVDQIYSQIKSSFITKNVTVGSIALILTTAMSGAEHLTGLSGPQKKQLVIYTVNRLLEEVPIDATEKTTIQLLIPSVIDMVISATKHQLDLNSEGKPSLLGRICQYFGCCS